MPSKPQWTTVCLSRRSAYEECDLQASVGKSLLVANPGLCVPVRLLVVALFISGDATTIGWALVRSWDGVGGWVQDWLILAVVLIECSEDLLVCLKRAMLLTVPRLVGLRQKPSILGTPLEMLIPPSGAKRTHHALRVDNDHEDVQRLT